MSLKKCSAWFAAICLKAQSVLPGIETAELHLDGPCDRTWKIFYLEGLVISIYGTWEIFPYSGQDEDPRTMEFLRIDLDFLLCKISGPVCLLVRPAAFYACSNAFGIK